MTPPVAPPWEEKEAPANQPAVRKVSRRGSWRAVQWDWGNFAALRLKYGENPLWF